MSDSSDIQGPFAGLKRSLLSGLLDRAKISGLLQDRIERQTGLKVHELHAYPFLHKLPPLPDFMVYTCGRERSLILPLVAELEPSTAKSQHKYINIDELSLCDSEYLRLNRCVIEGLAKDNKDKENPKFSRLSKCKYHYIIYTKCITKRNRMVDRIIFKNELDHLKNLAPSDKAAYLRNLELRIQEYRSTADLSTEESEKYVINRNAQHMDERLRRLRRELA